MHIRSLVFATIALMVTTLGAFALGTVDPLDTGQFAVPVAGDLAWSSPPDDLFAPVKRSSVADLNITCLDGDGEPQPEPNPQPDPPVGDPPNPPGVCVLTVAPGDLVPK